MRVSIIVRTKDEADRLRLTLASLARQSHPVEIIVVNDGSNDHSKAVIDEAAAAVPLVTIHHARARGRPGAANAGARIATGDVLIFLDGDTLAHPDLVARHAETHATSQFIVGRGETFHLRCTRFLKDPETGSPRPGEEMRIARIPPAELQRWCVTRKDIAGDFEGIAARAQQGIYPGAGPRQLYELEIDALQNHRDCTVLWAAAAGSNLSVRRDRFLELGGFDEAIDPNEHRELALRLCNAGARMQFVAGAKTFHMTHRSGWRDPLENLDWEATFLKAHPLPAVRLLVVFWAGLRDHAHRYRPLIGSLPELEAMSRSPTHVIEAARHASLGSAADARSSWAKPAS